MQTIHRNGKRFVLVPFDDYQRLTAALPPLPPAAADGSRDAIEFARASIARWLILERRGRWFESGTVGEDGGRAAGNDLSNRIGEAYGYHSGHGQNI